MLALSRSSKLQQLIDEGEWHHHELEFISWTNAYLLEYVWRAPYALHACGLSRHTLMHTCRLGRFLTPWSHPLFAVHVPSWILSKRYSQSCSLFRSLIHNSKCVVYIPEAENHRYLRLWEPWEAVMHLRTVCCRILFSAHFIISFSCFFQQSAPNSKDKMTVNMHTQGARVLRI